VTSASIIKTLGASELDTNELVTNLVNATKEPRQKIIDAEKKKAEVAISTAALLKSALSTLQNAATEIGSISNLNKLTVSSTDSSIATVRASSTGVARSATHSIEVIQLAQPQRTTSNALASTFTTSATTLTFSGGAAFTGGTISVDAGKTPAELVDLINQSSVAKNNKLTASLINTGAANPNKIVIESQTGATNSFTITDSEPTADTFGFESPSNLITQAKNSIVKVNAVQIERTTNVISDVVTGLTFQLNSAKEGTTVALSVATDSSQIVENVKNFVESYNLVNELITSAMGPAKEGDDVAGSLRSDSNARSAIAQLRIKLTGESSSKSGAITHWGTLGVSFDRNGVLQFDSAAFKTRFESNAEDAIKALSNNASSPYIYSGNPSGLAGDIAVAAYGLIKSTGSVTKMAEAFEARKTVVGKKQIDLDAHIERITAQYEKQFSALNSVLSSFRDTQEQLKRSLNFGSSQD
jgi:flagellar hook-associated protein 2